MSTPHPDGVPTWTPDPHGQAPGYDAVPAYAPTPGYDPVPTYAQAPGYGEPAGYGPTAGYGVPGAGPATGYGQPGLGAPPAYPQPAGYGPPTGYGHPAPPWGWSPVPFGNLASFGKRAAASLIDGAVIATPLFIAYFTFGLSLAMSADPYGPSDQAPSAAAVVFLLAGCLWFFVAWIWIRAFQQGRTGQSLGKRLVGIRLVGLQTGAPVGPGLAFGREIAHYVDSAIYVGYLWPLWDNLNQTLADKICRTVVIDA